jgi:hypothetical protein
MEIVIFKAAVEDGRDGEVDDVNAEDDATDNEEEEEEEEEGKTGEEMSPLCCFETFGDFPFSDSPFSLSFSFSLSSFSFSLE